MTIKLHTYDLQDIVIALIMNDSNVLKQKPDTVKALIETFGTLNSLCNESNDWTIELVVKA